MTPAFSPLLERAVELAAEWHDGTYRKGRWRPALFALPGDTPVQVPMMAHLVAVAMTVLRAGFDDETVAAALLHDSVEDANRAGERMREDAITSAVGARAAALVMDVTEPKLDQSGTPMRWQERKEVYVAHLRTAPLEAAAISLADKLHNLWTTNESIAAGIDVFRSTPERRGLSAGPAQQRWYYAAVLDATAHHTDARVAALHTAVSAQLARFEQLVGLGE